MRSTLIGLLIQSVAAADDGRRTASPDEGAASDASSSLAAHARELAGAIQDPLMESWGVVRYENLSLLQAPLALMTDLANGRVSNPASALAFDYGTAPMVVEADAELESRLLSRLGWMQVSDDIGLTFGVQAVCRRFSPREHPTTWSYEVFLGSQSGTLDTTFLWPADGWFDQVHCHDGIGWTPVDVFVCDDVLPTASPPQVPCGALSMAVALSWVPHFAFDLGSQVVRSDSDDPALVRVLDASGTELRRISFRFEDERLARLSIQQFPVTFREQIGTLSGNGVSEPVMVEYQRWPDGLQIDIDFQPVDATADAPSRIRAFTHDQLVMEASFEFTLCGTRGIVEDPVSPQDLLDARDQSLQLYMECYELGLDAGPDRYAAGLSEIGQRVRSIAPRLGLPPESELQFLERVLAFISMGHSELSPIQSALLKAGLRKPYRDAVRALPWRTGLSEMLRQLSQDRSWIAWFTFDAIDRPSFSDDAEEIWWQRVQSSLNSWRFHVPGASPQLGRPSDTDFVQGRADIVQAAIAEVQP